MEKNLSPSGSLSTLKMSDGFSAFLEAMGRIRRDPELKSWYRKTIIKTALLAIVLLVLTLAVGIYYAQSIVDDIYSRILVVGIVAFAALYFSTTIAALLMNVLVMNVGGEGALRRHFFPGNEARGGLHLKDRGGEVLSVLKSLGFAFLAVPFFMMGYLIPVGILIIALGMGGEALATAQRLSHEHGIVTAQDQKRLNWQLRMGLGLIPAAMSLIPLLGFFVLPLSVIGALSLQNQKRSSPPY